MAKDPAVLFYTSDFISGTITMSDSQRGQYIMLLCLQHQKGYLTEKDMLKICNSYDEDIWCKFEVENGQYYNKRMKMEAEKRKKYSESRSNNRKKKEKSNEDKKKICKTYDYHMENENEDINIVLNEIKGICKNYSDEVFLSFENWRDYLIKQHDVVLKENEYTYQILLKTLKKYGAQKTIDNIKYSITRNWKQILPEPDQKPPQNLSHLNQAAKHDSDKF